MATRTDRTDALSFAARLRGGDAALRTLLRRLDENQRLTAAAREAVGPPGAAHIIGACTSNHKLVVLADSPVWATRFRFQLESQLKNILENRGLKRVLVRTSQLSGAAAPPHRRARISARSREFLSATAESTCDPALRSIYRRLARRRGD